MYSGEVKANIVPPLASAESDNEEQNPRGTPRLKRRLPPGRSPLAKPDEGPVRANNADHHRQGDDGGRGTREICCDGDGGNDENNDDDDDDDAESTFSELAARLNPDGGDDSLAGSLEDLVGSFDEKLKQCFQDYQEQVEKIAPVQVRSHEEIMNECQVWWTLTGNFGNMMPIDWSKSMMRAKQLSALNLKPPGEFKEKASSRDGGGGGKPQSSSSTATSRGSAARFSPRGRAANNGGFLSSGNDDDDLDEDEEDDLVAADLDMHSLILTSNPQENAEPVKSADEVIKEIDEIIDAADVDEDEDLGHVADDVDDDDDDDDGIAGGGGPSLASDDPGQIGPLKSLSMAAASGGGHHHHHLHHHQQHQPPFMPSLPLSARRIMSQALRGRSLDDLSVNELTQILGDIEILIKELSEELVADLNVRDELEYEKELKNTFISLLLSIQSRRRALATTGGTDGSKEPSGGALTRPGGPKGLSGQVGSQQQQQQQPLYKYLTTVIPYQPEKGTPSLHGLQVLVKILKAINEDSPAVPALLTDYILKVLCPS